MEHDTAERPEGLDRLLQDLSFTEVEHPSSRPSLRLSVLAGAAAHTVPGQARETLRVDGVRGAETDAGFWLTDGTSSLHVTPAHAEVRVAPDFFAKQEEMQRNFWSFALMKLLRTQHVFALHAAALVSPEGEGLLIVAKPGSGKSTLAIGLVRRGWGYLSDDAVLLRREDSGVAALALRRDFYVDSDDGGRYANLRREVSMVENATATRQRLGIHLAFPKQYEPICRPTVVMFPRIESQRTSMLRPIGAVAATHLLLQESGSQLTDRRYAAAHLDLLSRLTAQSRMFEMRSGRDVYSDPGAVAGMMQKGAA